MRIGAFPYTRRCVNRATHFDVEIDGDVMDACDGCFNEIRRYIDSLAERTDVEAAE